MTDVAPGTDVAVLILSCDRYKDTWPAVSAAFDKYWPDCPYPIRLLTNHEHFEHPRIEPIAVGRDKDWSSNLLQMLDRVGSKYVILWLDDVFPSALVNTARVEGFVEFVRRGEAKFIRMRPVPAPRKWRNDGLGVLDRSASYRVSVFATIWDTATLKQIARAGESPWSFELDGTERAKILDGFYATRHPVFNHIHGIEKGVWLRSAVAWLARHDMKVDLGYRRQMTHLEAATYRARQLKGFAMGQVPERYRKHVLRVARVAYRMLGRRGGALT